MTEGQDKEKEFEAMFGDSDEEEEAEAEASPPATTAAAAEEEEEEKQKEDEDEDEGDKKRAQFEAMFGDSDDEEEEEEEKQPSASKKALSKLAKKVKKGKAKTSKGGRLTKRQRAAENEKENKKKKQKGSKDETALWDFVDSEDDGEGVEDADDKKFIDNDGADDLFESSGDEEEQDAGEAPQAEEAMEEDDEIERRIQQRKARGRKRKDLDPQEKAHICRSILSRMEAAFDADNEAVKKQKPAIHKLKLLSEVDNILSLRHMHETLLYEGVLNVLKSWLSPLPDGTLPNVMIRGTLLRVLQLMNIRPYDDKLDKLKSSGIAKIVMFLFKVSDETAENKKIARALIQGWSKPIFARGKPQHVNTSHEYEEEDRGAATKRGSGGDRMRSMTDGDMFDGDRGNKKVRLRASMVRASNMTYTRQPKSTVDHKRALANKPEEKASERRYREKIVKKSQDKRFQRSTKLSIEGRGM